MMLSQFAKTLAKAILPEPLAKKIRDWRIARFKERSKSMTTQEVFTRIYNESIWGTSRDGDTPFYSGSGSHDSRITDIYVEKVCAFLSQFPEKPNVVDLGCGDFSIGSRIRPFCANYTACDIVEPLIAFNAKHFAALNVDFRVVNLATDPLPEGDIVFIRQVLQHLSNAEIAAALPRIAQRYRYMVLTEHLPAVDDFIPNIDKKAGADIRLDQGSGLVLTQPPFSLNPLETLRLCEVPEFNGRVQTTVYTLR
jgi:Methyltransferase domain